MGVPTEPFDDYTLRKFARGKAVEEWLCDKLKIDGIDSTQIKVKYRDVNGVIDLSMETKDWSKDFGLIPIEIKSVANAKFKRIVTATGADRGHILQACLYAMAVKSKYFAIAYISSDDLRIQTYVYQTDQWEGVVDEIIDIFNAQIKTKKVPVFEAEESWQENVKYNKYPEWSKLTQKEINTKLKTYVNKN